MRFVSVCSGIEAASVAWNPLGWKAVAFSEIEKFPCAVLKHHYPDVPNLGDMTKYDEWNLPEFDVLCGGTPCQGFSVAGQGKGLDDPRSQLAIAFVEIAARNRPRWLVWENVPGVFSTNGGQDFATFLGALTGRTIPIPENGFENSGIIEGISDAYGIAWRVLDAQYSGLAQRRERVFVVGYLGDWRRAAAVLFESASLCWHPAPRRETGKGFAADVAGSLGSRGNKSHTELDGPGAYVPSLAGCVTTGEGKRYDSETCTFIPVNGNTPHEDFQALEIAPPLMSGSGHRAGHGAGSGHCKDSHIVPISFSGQMSVPQTDENLSQTLGAKNPMAVATNARVRRLTPRECERLMGFEDDYTLIPFRNKPACDGPRYKALGNSWAVPAVRWIGRRIDTVESLL